MKHKTVTYVLFICLVLVWLVTYHAMNQTQANAKQAQQEQLQRERERSVVGWVRQDLVTKQLYYEEVKKP